MKKIVNFSSLAIGLLVGGIVFLVSYQLSVGLIEIPFVGPLIGVVLGLIALGCLVYPGFQALPEVSNSILSIAGLRIKTLVFDEGPAWRPPFISRFLIESTKMETFNYPELQCMSLDNQLVTINGAVQCRTYDVNLVLEVADFRATLRQVYENSLRIAAHGKKAEELPGSKQWMGDVLHKGGHIPTNDPNGATIELPGLDNAVLALGKMIMSITITEIALSEEYRKQLEAKTLEAVQANAEDTDTDTLVRNFDKAHAAMATKGVPGNEILAALQARRGLSKNISVSGGTPIERGAAILGDALSGGGQPPQGNNPPPQGSGPIKQRRRS